MPSTPPYYKIERRNSCRALLDMTGHLCVITGCMFAQKTTELLRRIRRYESIGYRVLTINYAGDTRYGANCISSHDHEQQSAVCVATLQEVEEHVYSGAYQVIAIDEGQFFPDLFDCVTQWVDQLRIHIVVVGLDGTFDRKPFGDMLRLLPHAEEIERLTAYCAVCRDGTPAIFSKRIQQNNTDIVAIGGASMYQPVCRRHFLAREWIHDPHSDHPSEESNRTLSWRQPPCSRNPPSFS